MQKDHKHLLIVEVDLVQFDEICTWREKFHFAFFFKHNGRKLAYSNVKTKHNPTQVNSRWYRVQLTRVGYQTVVNLRWG